MQKGFCFIFIIINSNHYAKISWSKWKFFFQSRQHSSLAVTGSKMDLECFKLLINEFYFISMLLLQPLCADLLVQVKILFLETGCTSSAVTGSKRDLGNDCGNKNATADHDFPLFISRRRILHTRRHAHHSYQGLFKMFKKLVCNLKVSKSWKQIFLFSFEPKKKTNEIIFWFLP